ncbi:MAG TPA: hypothetical protein VK484_08000 [Ferruginibacter sp.]|nr:hypothetical protein [Ferruginibacter sp.]
MAMKYLFTLFMMANASISNAQTEIDKYRVIFPAGTRLDDVHGRFTPDINDINKADSISTLYISSGAYKNQYVKGVIKNYQEYFKQYFGLIVDGQKVIFINATCRMQACFLSFLCYPKGGGACYFKAKARLADEKIIGFSVNAPK